MIGIAAPQASRATDIFVNDTGAPVTDFHFVETPRKGTAPVIPKSYPWGDGTAAQDPDDELSYIISYSGPPIPVNGSLRFENNALVSNVFYGVSGFTWTPGGQPATWKQVPSAVPEAKIWAMMLIGFSGVAVMLRRSRVIQARYTSCQGT
jgi:hypothetical protein